MARIVRLNIPPGIVKSTTRTSATGRYTDSDKVREDASFIEKIGGWDKLINDQFIGIVRGAYGFRDEYGNQHVCFGSAFKLYVLEALDTLTDVTPARASGTLGTDPFTTTSGSAVVNVAHIAHGAAQVDDYVNFTGATAVGGITIDGDYQITSIVDDDNYTITHSSTASSSATGGGSSVDYIYDIAHGDVDALSGTGYGAGAYGSGTYSTPRTTGSIFDLDPRIWSVRNYGNDALALPKGGALYQWDYSVQGRATAVTNAPDGLAMVVTEERYILILGAVPNGESTIDPMVVRWPDITDNTDWTPSATNTANERRLQLGAQLMGGEALKNGVTLVFSDSTAYVFQYTGSQFIYDSRVAGTNCGLVGTAAAVPVDSVCYWMSEHTFHMYNGVVQQIPNADDIKQYVFDNVNRDQIRKCFGGFNPKFREVWWLYPATGSDEIDSYVFVNIDTYNWYTGTLDRSAYARFRSEQGTPLLFGTDGYIYWHDKPGVVDADGSAMNAYIEAGMTDVDDGNASVDVFGFIPDLDRHVGDLTVLTSMKDHAEDSDFDTDSVTLSEGDVIVDIRAGGRQFGYKITSNAVGGDFRFGTNKLEINSRESKR